ncbi:multicopper oxidase family protein [Magnetovibrio sp. PR-2]|uniref:multicopper oxidase family protein n=1 Tax=Magnetovibrio sp. PR-2 TaxID=3120356 RepID=UPI002FCE34F5
MKSNKSNLYSRRQILAGGSALAFAGTMPSLSLAAQKPQHDFLLKAEASTTQILPSNWSQTPLWTYSGKCPGPVIRAKQGERVRILVENNLDEATTVHWHGLRVPNAMDGVPHVTQAPIEPGQNYHYDFKLEDAGTYWYHPHVNSSEQLGRGLYGTIIVEETDPPEVDRDEVWVLDDWRVSKDGTIRNDFENGMDISHGGRMGNYITINGSPPEPLKVTANERIRLRLANVANARIFGLSFENHDVKVIAIDGHPVTPHAPLNDMVLLGPGQRADVIIDCLGKPGSKHRIMDIAYQQSTNELQDIEYLDTPPLRKKPLGPIKVLPPTPCKNPT